MAIQIGAKPENDFDNPLGLLSDCHRRIERFLDQLITVTRDARGGPLSEMQESAFVTALNYFRRAAPLHTQDEEASLFPRMRASDSAAAADALEALARLEADHDRADEAHEEIDALGRRWAADRRLTRGESDRLLHLLTELREMYREHIAVEDSQVFVAAGGLLNAEQIRQIGREMAERRGLDPDNLPSISHCQLRKAPTPSARS